MKYIVNVSGGMTSAEALRRCLIKYGHSDTIALFADTNNEDEDLYRFLDDIEKYFGLSIIRLSDGRTPWDVAFAKRAIKIKTATPCSQTLKREMIDAYLMNTYAMQDITLVFGMDWNEPHRIIRLSASYEAPCWFPLNERPYIDKQSLIEEWESRGIKSPRLYSLGFSHNNCGGACFRAGQAQWAKLLQVFPEKYAENEQREQEFISYIGKKRTILRHTVKGKVYPLTLAELREKVKNDEYDKNDIGGCGCYVGALDE